MVLLTFLKFGALLLGTLTAVIAIRGDTFDKEHDKLTPRGRRSMIVIIGGFAIAFCIQLVETNTELAKNRSELAEAARRRQMDEQQHFQLKEILVKAQANLASTEAIREKADQSRAQSELARMAANEATLQVKGNLKETSKLVRQTQIQTDVLGKTFDEAKRSQRKLEHLIEYGQGAAVNAWNAQHPFGTWKFYIHYEIEGNPFYEYFKEKLMTKDNLYLFSGQFGPNYKVIVLKNSDLHSTLPAIEFVRDRVVEDTKHYKSFDRHFRIGVFRKGTQTLSDVELAKEYYDYWIDAEFNINAYVIYLDEQDMCKRVEVFAEGSAIDARNGGGLQGWTDLYGDRVLAVSRPETTWDMEPLPKIKSLSMGYMDTIMPRSASMKFSKKDRRYWRTDVIDLDRFHCFYRSKLTAAELGAFPKEYPGKPPKGS